MQFFFIPPVDTVFLLVALAHTHTYTQQIINSNVRLHLNYCNRYFYRRAIFCKAFIGYDGMKKKTTFSINLICIQREGAVTFISEIIKK